MNVNHPYFDEIEVKINDSEVEGYGTMDYNRYIQMSQQITGAFSGGSAPVNMGYQQPMNNQAQMNCQQNQYAQPSYAQQPNMYQQSYQYGQPMQYQQPTQYAQPNQFGQQNTCAQQNPYGQQNMQVQGWTCRNCNAVNNAGNFCAFCGAPKG